MSVLKKKSEENFQAIDILISSKLYAPVIHCAYYSSLQLVIHFINEYSVVTGELKSNEVAQDGSRNFYINTILTELKRLNSHNAVQFYKYFNNFKRKRNEADYHEFSL